MGVLRQVLEIIFQVQSKTNNERLIRREINFPTYKTPLTFKPHNFFLFYSF
jgi:hypothetical protein